MTYCQQCLKKQQKINEHEEELASVNAKLHYQQRTAKEGLFGSSTPSSKIPVDVTDKQFKRQTAKIKKEIVSIVNRQARHPAIRKIQDIFREKADRLYHWARNRDIPADNNLAERELRPLVIARKLSFGSQSDVGAKTREILMTVLHTLKKRTSAVTTSFKAALDKLVEQSSIAPYAIFNFDSS